MKHLALIQEIQQLSVENRLKKLQELDLEDLVVVLHHLDNEDVNNYLSNLSDEMLSDFVLQSSLQNVVRLVSKLTSESIKRINNKLAEEKRKKLELLLSFPVDSAGSMMSLNYLAMPVHSTRSEILDAIQRSLLSPEELERIWLVNSSDELQGYIKIAELVCCNTEDIRDITHTVRYFIDGSADQEEALNIIFTNKIQALPVYSKLGGLLGIISTDTAMEIMSEEYQEDIFNITGVTSNHSPYLETSSFNLAKNRIIWLLFLLITATFTGLIIQHYETLLASTVVLAAFIPMLMDSGGNAGGQSSAIIIQSLATNDVKLENIFQIIKKELSVSLLTGGLLFLVNAVRLVIFDDMSLKINLIVSLSLMVTVMIASIVGSLLPLLAKVMKQDPTVMSGPLVTTIVDVSALIIYFQLASAFL